MIDKILVEELEKLKKDGKTIGLCHGCFDILHYGHILHFKEAKSMVDHLVVSVTCDKYVNKGSNRPIFIDSERAEVLKAIKYIDKVVISYSDTAINIMKHIPFDVYIKGPDYKDSNDKRLKSEIDYAKTKGKVYYTSGVKYSSSKVIEIFSSTN